MDDNVARSLREHQGEPSEAIALALVANADATDWDELHLSVQVVEPGVFDFETSAVSTGASRSVRTPADVCVATNRWYQILVDALGAPWTGFRLTVTSDGSFTVDADYPSEGASGD